MTENTVQLLKARFDHKTTIFVASGKWSRWEAGPSTMFDEKRLEKQSGRLPKIEPATGIRS